VTAATGALDLTVHLSDDDVERIASAVARQWAERVPHWLPDRPLTPTEVADWLGVSEQTLRRWRKSGRLPAFEEGSVILYTPAQLAAGLGRPSETDAGLAGDP